MILLHEFFYGHCEILEEKVRKLDPESMTFDELHGQSEGVRAPNDLSHPWARG